MAVVFAGEAYFRRPWWVHELRLLSTGWRDDPPPPAKPVELTDAVVVVLPTGGDVAQLPPPLVRVSWPTVEQTGALAALVQAKLDAVGPVASGERLAGLADETVIARGVFTSVADLKRKLM